MKPKPLKRPAPIRGALLLLMVGVVIATGGIARASDQPAGNCFAGGYFDMMRDYILDGSLHGKYGHAVLYRTLNTTPDRPRP